MDSSQRHFVKKISKIAPILLSVTLFGISVWAIYGQLHQYHLSAIVQSVKGIPAHQVLLALGFMVLNIVVMTWYDALAMRHMQQTLAYRRIAFAAVLSSVDQQQCWICAAGQ